MYKKYIRYLIIAVVLIIFSSGTGYAQEENPAPGDSSGVMALHAFYPAFAAFSPEIGQYIDQVDSVSFAWSRIYGDAPGSLVTKKGEHGNYSFYYPEDYLEPVRYAKSQGKQIQLSIYSDADNAKMILADENKRQEAISAVVAAMQQDIGSGEGLFYDGAVIDFEGLKDKDTDGNAILIDGKPVSSCFNAFLSDLKLQLEAINRKLYVAVNPRLYYNGYDYGSIAKIADKMIVMAHDYVPVVKLKKSEVLQYTGYNTLYPIDSLAPINRVRQALDDVKASVSGEDMNKVWLQVAFISAQWEFAVSSIDEWDTLDDSALSMEGRQIPLYSKIEDRADNADGNGYGITYGYNNQLQTAFMQYFNKEDKTYNVILYEDSNSMAAKINTAKAYGLGGISVWSLGNAADWKDEGGKAFHLDAFSTIVSDAKTPAVASGGDTVKFSNKLIESAVRTALDKPEGDIYKSELKNVYRLRLPKGTAKLDDLKNLVNLEYLDAQDAGISSLKALSELTKLRVLYLQRNAISDISPLKGLKYLEILSLNGNRLSDAGAIAGLTGLKELYLNENKLTSVYPLRNLTGLRKLYLNNNKINSVSYLSGLKNLYELGLEGNTISDLKPLAGLKKLKFLNLSGNRITDITSVKGLTKLKTLYLQRNSLKSISSLKGLSGLTELSVNGNRIADISALGSLLNMKKLYIKDNVIMDITALKSLKNLEVLYLGGNKIKSLTPVKGLYGKLTETDIKIN